MTLHCFATWLPCRPTLLCLAGSDVVGRPCWFIGRSPRKLRSNMQVSNVCTCAKFMHLNFVDPILKTNKC